MSSTNIFYGIGQFIEWILGVISAPGWAIPVVITAVLIFGMVYWLWAETRYTRRAKERDEFI